eukprot:CAMPEP_0174296922 /NCGR_PEP_ID=MMETSP0809-20121228/49390_1 /TAXON_ID=73025 ORGANISM="Eutreptiella gymnastica-like, Strain CCMP1594" /NCGR_SAMPLE_ID=MMETSP0809 /ASSEMBLY_ACC=CAM_ASM_000658 /LENGTH=82 /DNA_ID=CAMNT_0015400293 /DNA_START=44 /DNA_END=292 /DNA_ORIENTATION=-
MPKLCCGKPTDQTQLTQAKDLFCNQGIEEVKKDPAKATELLKGSIAVLKKSGHPKHKALAELADNPVDKFDDIKSILQKVPS